jgi:hypothetical protein
LVVFPLASLGTAKGSTTNLLRGCLGWRRWSIAQGGVPRRRLRPCGGVPPWAVGAPLKKCGMSRSASLLRRSTLYLDDRSVKACSVLSG